MGSEFLEMMSRWPAQRAGAAARLSPSRGHGQRAGIASGILQPSALLRRMRHWSICSRDALRTDSDHRAYRPCHRREGTADTTELIYRCYRLRAAPLSVTTTGREGQPEDGPRRRSCRRRLRRPPRRRSLSSRPPPPPPPLPPPVSGIGIGPGSGPGPWLEGWSSWRTWAAATTSQAD